MKKHIVLLMLVMLLVLCLSGAALAVDSRLETALEKTAAYVEKTTPTPGISTSGGDWAVLGLARDGYAVDEGYYDQYYATVTQEVKEKNGVLSERKYSEYARVALALTAIGKDPTQVGGYNLLAPLGDYEQTIWQGINGAAFALLALDSADYAVPTAPTGKTQASREMYVDCLLQAELENGGWALSGTEADADLTAMVLQALAKYTEDSQVKAAVERGLTALSAQQNADGSFSTGDVATCESTAQVVVALGELGISLSDSRFVKNENDVLDGLLPFALSDGSFCHQQGGKADTMATEQAFYALVAADRLAKGESSLYQMDDVTVATENGNGSATETEALTDIAGYQYEAEIQALYDGGFISGMGDGTFQPEKVLSRAEFSTMIVKALALPEKTITTFQDVDASAWYAGFVGAAYDYGMITGRSETLFDPEGDISDNEAQIIMDRIAVEWAPSTGTVTRGETVHLLYQLLVEADKL